MKNSMYGGGLNRGYRKRSIYDRQAKYYKWYTWWWRNWRCALLGHSLKYPHQYRVGMTDAEIDALPYYKRQGNPYWASNTSWKCRCRVCKTKFHTYGVDVPLYVAVYGGIEQFVRCVGEVFEVTKHRSRWFWILFPVWVINEFCRCVTVGISTYTKWPTEPMLTITMNMVCWLEDHMWSWND